MRFFGGLQMTKMGWLALAVAGGVVACGENDTLDPVDTSPSTDGTGSTVSSQTSMTTSTSSASTHTTATTSTAPTTTSANSTTTTSTSSAASSSSSATSSSTSATSTATSDETSSETTSDETSDATSSAETSSDETTGGGGKPPADKSAGCGKANPQTGSSGQPLNVSNHQYYVKLPQNYDASTPYPVIIMFNPTGNPISWAEGSAGFEQVAKDAIRVYPHMGNQNNGWNPSDANFFEPFYNKILEDYCVDKARVFAAGESSGGDIVGYLGCAHADKLRGIGPGAPKTVGGWPLNAGQANCSGQVHATIIYSDRDSVLQSPSGAPMTTYYRTLNHCSDMSDPVQGYTDKMSNCVQYRDCDEDYPVIRCLHEDPEYGGTYHGWPKFAAKMLWETWSEL